MDETLLQVNAGEGYSNQGPQSLCFQTLRLLSTVRKSVRPHAGGHVASAPAGVIGPFFLCLVPAGPALRPLSEAEFEQLSGVMRQRREEHGFLLTAWALMPDHWHAIIFPRFPLTISRVMEAIKVGPTLRIDCFLLPPDERARI